MFKTNCKIAIALLPFLLTSSAVFAQGTVTPEILNGDNVPISSKLTDTAYWHNQALSQSTGNLIQQMQQLTYPEVSAKGSWLLYHLKINDALTVPYLVHIPVNYNPAKRTSLYVFLHGAATRKTFGNPAATAAAMEKVLEIPLKNAIILYPFARENFNWLFHQQAFEAIAEQIRQVKTRYNVNDNKVYIGGHSDGARGAFWFALNNSSPFAACFGICYEPLLFTNTPLRNLRNTYFYGISANNDVLFNNRQVNQIFNYGRSIGVNWYNYNVTGGHDLPFASPDSIGFLFHTLLGKSRNVLPKRITYEVADVKNGRCAWLQVDALDTLQEVKNWVESYKLKVTQSGSQQEEALNLTPSRYGAITAEVKNNTVTIKTSRIKALTIYALNGFFDMSKPITIKLNDDAPYTISLKADNRFLVDEFLKTADREMLALCKIALNVK